MSAQSFKRYFSPAEFTGPGGYREIGLIAYPLILMSASTVVMQFADRKFLGNSSTEELAAAMPSGILYFTLFCFLQVTAGFTATLVAQHHGAGHRRDCVEAAWSGLYFGAASSLLILATVPFLGYWILAKTMSPTLFAPAWDYFRSLIPTGAFACLSVPLFSFFSGRGKTLPVALINIFICIANVFFDWLLIFGHWGFPRWGIFGAGAATSLSMFLGLIAVAIMFWNVDQKEYPTRTMRKYHPEVVRKLFKFGSPTGLQVLSDVGSFTLILLIVGKLGDLPLAAATIAFSINNLSFLPLLGLSEATSILTGQMIGRKQRKTVPQLVFRAWRLAFLYMLLTGIFYVSLPGVIASFFAPDNAAASAIDFAAVAEQSRWVLLMAALWNLGDTGKFIFAAALRGAGDTRAILIIGLVCVWCLNIPGIYILVYIVKPHIAMIWGYLVITTTIEGICLFFRFQTGRWRKIKLIKPTNPAEIPEQYEHLPL